MATRTTPTPVDLSAIPPAERYAPLISLAKRAIFGTLAVAVFMFLFIMAAAPDPVPTTQTQPLPVSDSCEAINGPITVRDVNRDGFIDCRRSDETGRPTPTP